MGKRSREAAAAAGTISKSSAVKYSNIQADEADEETRPSHKRQPREMKEENASSQVPLESVERSSHRRVDPLEEDRPYLAAIKVRFLD